MKNALIFLFALLFLPVAAVSDTFRVLDTDCPGSGCPSYNPEADFGCPDSRFQALAGDAVPLNGDDSGLSVGLIAGGYSNFHGCGVMLMTDQIDAHFMSAPSLRLDLSNVDSRKLIVSVESECDTVLLVDSATASRYIDDDDNGNLDARVVLTRPSSGFVEVWVGLREPGLCTAKLNVEVVDR